MIIHKITLGNVYYAIQRTEHGGVIGKGKSFSEAINMATNALTLKN